MNVEIRTEDAQFPFWEYFSPIFVTVSLQCVCVSEQIMEHQCGWIISVVGPWHLDHFPSLNLKSQVHETNIFIFLCADAYSCVETLSESILNTSLNLLLTWLKIICETSSQLLVDFIRISPISSCLKYVNFPYKSTSTCLVFSRLWPL